MEEIPKELYFEPSTTDAEAVSEMVGLIVHRRPREEGRRNSRFPTPEVLRRGFDSHAPMGLIFCDNETPLRTGGETPELSSNSRLHHPRSRRRIEIISEFHVVDFSEKGMQVQFACDNPLRYARKQFYLQVEDFPNPVAMQWFTENQGTVRAGVLFQKSLTESPVLAATLAELSDRLISYLIHCHIENHVFEFGEIAVFAFFCILYNLRLKYVQALSILNRTCKALGPSVGSTRQDHDTLKFPLEYARARGSELQIPGRMLGTKDYKESFDIFMKPYYAFGCSLPGAEGRLIFLEEEVGEIVANFLLSPENKTPFSKDFIGQLQGVHDCFLVLQELLPELLESEKFTQQFGYYNNLIGSVILAREALINLTSHPGQGQKDLGAADSRLPVRDSGLAVW